MIEWQVVQGPGEPSYFSGLRIIRVPRQTGHWKKTGVDGDAGSRDGDPLIIGVSGAVRADWRGKIFGTVGLAGGSVLPTSFNVGHDWVPSDI